MLSRVAENIYWMARYVERAENTARIINVNANLLLDLPQGIAPGWAPIIAITGSGDLYRERYGDCEERNVLKFLVGDANNPGSILNSLAFARENARSIRDFIPREAWEHLNEVYLYARDNVQTGLAKRGRYHFLRQVIRGAQTLTGMLAGTMNHDAGYDFLRIGRNLERADMTTRIVDVRSASLLPEQAGLRPFETIQWVSVLKSLTAYQMYRRKMQARVERAAVLRFLFQDRDFPRAFYHCVGEAEQSLANLGRNDAPLRVLGRLKRSALNADLASLSQQEVHALIDQLQLGLSDLHEEIARAYFLVAVSASQVQAA
jgi:uncharacterized alpha-E superfamily protein